MMTHEEQRIWLLKYLLKEDHQYQDVSIPEDDGEQKQLLRALMNVRMPKAVSQEFFKVQDEYLKDEITKGGIVDADELPSCPSNEKVVLWQGDITTLKIDAIVNAANSQMCGCFRANHNCIDNIIHTKAGVALRLKCYDIMQEQGYEEPTGRAKITPAYNLPCKYVLHTVGPIVQGRLTEKHCELLKSSYQSCLELADENSVSSIAFCCISTGVFMFPNQKAAEIAVDTVQSYLEGSTRIKRVVFNVFKDEDYRIYSKLLA